MKKFIVLIAALLAALFIAGCASKPAAPSGPSASDLLASAKGNAPSGVLVGQAVAKQGSKEDSIKKAEQNAMLQILKAIQYIATEMVDEQTTSGRISAANSAEFKQTLNLAISRSSIGDAVKVESGAGAGDTGYAVYYLDKAGALKIFNVAVTAAKEAVSARNFNNDNFDSWFAKAAAREWK